MSIIPVESVSLLNYVIQFFFGVEAGAGSAPAPLKPNSYFSAQVRIEEHLKKIIIILPLNPY